MENTKIKAVLFDLDGTLLPMDQECFVKDYFGRIASFLAPLGYDPACVPKAIWKGTAAMVANDGSVTNETAFWRCFSAAIGFDAYKDEPKFNEFYEREFDKVKASCGYDPSAAQAVRRLKELGYRTVLATNPIFPAIATKKRVSWTGLSTDDFELYTTYENSSFCKPGLDYYRAILERIALRPEECVMVGNDVEEDMVARELGMKVFLVTPCIINRSGKDVGEYPHGTLAELVKYIESL